MITPEKTTQKQPKQPPNLVEDFRKLARWSATVGAILAVVCHLLPPQYRVVCTTLANFCTGGSQ